MDGNSQDSWRTEQDVPFEDTLVAVYQAHAGDKQPGQIRGFMSIKIGLKRQVGTRFQGVSNAYRGNCSCILKP